MSDIVERAKAALEGTDCSDDMMDFFRVGLVRELVAELERLHTWDGLMSLLDEHWPEVIFPTIEDQESRDPGPRIVSLIRWVDQLRAPSMSFSDEIGAMHIAAHAAEMRKHATPADEGDQPLGEKPAVTRDDLLAQGPW